MLCPLCSIQNADGAKFCGNCGGSLADGGDVLEDVLQLGLPETRNPGGAPPKPGQSGKGLDELLDSLGTPASDILLEPAQPSGILPAPEDDPLTASIKPQTLPPRPPPQPRGPAKAAPKEQKRLTMEDIIASVPDRPVNPPAGADDISAAMDNPYEPPPGVVTGPSHYTKPAAEEPPPEPPPGVVTGLSHYGATPPPMPPPREVDSDPDPKIGATGVTPPQSGRPGRAEGRPPPGLASATTVPGLRAPGEGAVAPPPGLPGLGLTERIEKFIEAASPKVQMLACLLLAAVLGDMGRHLMSYSTVQVGIAGGIAGGALLLTVFLPGLIDRRHVAKCFLIAATFLAVLAVANVDSMPEQAILASLEVPVAFNVVMFLVVAHAALQMLSISLLPFRIRFALAVIGALSTVTLLEGAISGRTFQGLLSGSGLAEQLPDSLGHLEPTWIAFNCVLSTAVVLTFFELLRCQQEKRFSDSISMALSLLLFAYVARYGVLAFERKETPSLLSGLMTADLWVREKATEYGMELPVVLTRDVLKEAPPPPAPKARKGKDKRPTSKRRRSSGKRAPRTKPRSRTR